MGVSFAYRPVKPSTNLDYTTGGRSALKEKFERIFGSMPCRMDDSCMGELSTLMKAEPEEKFWENIVDAITKHGAIDVIAEY